MKDKQSVADEFNRWAEKYHATENSRMRLYISGYLDALNWALEGSVLTDFRKEEPSKDERKKL